ncbi:MAG: TonB-dependent receptor [Myxococcota bacterium]
MRWPALLVLSLGVGPPVAADPPDVDAESPRSPRRLLEAPLSISVVSREEFARDRPTLGLEDALDLVPGVFAQSSLNFAQDTRISIRGFGARSSFGVRGIRIRVDGVPTTLADGQSEVDSVDLAFAERIEVVRSPISSLYGGGGGGAIFITTLEPTPRPEVRVRSLLGSDHMSRHEASITGQIGRAGVMLGIATTRYGSHRDHARGRQTAVLAKVETDLPNGGEIGAHFSGVFAPEAQDPGALTATEVRENPSAAHPNARPLDTGERLHQERVGVRLRQPLGPGRDLRLTAYYLDRSFRNALPFRPRGRVDLERSAGGGSLVYTQRWQQLRWMLGVDVDVQKDLRWRYDNDDGGRGDLRLRQSETVRSAGPFGEVDWNLGGGFGVVGGLRYDWTEFEVGDRFTADGDDSDRVRFRELSPRLGFYYTRSTALNFYANLATAFQVPTTTELARGAQGGFNADLEPERALSLEAGLKGIPSEWFIYDIALFALRVRDALVSFEDPTGRTLFRNAAEVERRGLEFGASLRIHPRVHLRTAYTLLDARYRDFDTFSGGRPIDHDGNREPNIPRHNLTTELRMETSSGLFAVLAVHHQSSFPVNDQNDLDEDAATTADLRVGFERVRGALRMVPFAGIKNFTDVEHAGTARPNAGFGRYFEPAAGIQVYGGMSIEARF